MKAIYFDMDGTIYRENDLFDGVKELLENITANGGRFVFITNNATASAIDYVKKLINILSKLRNAGNTVVVIEHNLDVIKTADYLIDLGPEGGNGGGTIVCKGTPEEVAKNTQSYTGKFLKNVL